MDPEQIAREWLLQHRPQLSESVHSSPFECDVALLANFARDCWPKDFPAGLLDKLKAKRAALTDYGYRTGRTNDSVIASMEHEFMRMAIELCDAWKPTAPGDCWPKELQWTHEVPKDRGYYLLWAPSDQSMELVFVGRNEEGLVLLDRPNGDPFLEQIDDLHESHWWFGPVAAPEKEEV